MIVVVYGLGALLIGDQGPEICCAVSNVPRLLQPMTSLPLTGGALVNMAAACNFAAEARIPRPLARIIILRNRSTPPCLGLRLPIFRFAVKFHKKCSGPLKTDLL